MKNQMGNTSGGTDTAARRATPEKSAHTPGPWVRRGAFFIVGGNPETQIADTNINEARETNKANAVLIAAAPELLDALRLFVTALRGKAMSDAESVAYKAARAAILRAEGKS